MKIIVVEVHNTDRPESAWKNAPDGDRLIKRNGAKNEGEYVIKSSTVDSNNRRSYELEAAERWFADDLYPLLGGKKHLAVSWFEIDL